MDGPPLRSGAVLIGDGGRLVAAGPSDSVPRPEGAASEHFEGMLIPGLVNVHTHLELTGLAHRAPPDDFAGWIAELRRAKAERSPGGFTEAARLGLRDAFAMGITTVADTGDSGAVLPALAEVDGSGIVYQEVFGPHPAQLAGSLAGLKARVAELRRFETARARLGASPHAPYTVSGALYRAVARWARAEGLRLAVHLAESRAETDLVVRGDGPFAEAWRARGIPPLADQAASLGASLRSPIAWLDALGVIGPETLCIHAVQADVEDLALLAARGAAVAACLLSNARHGHGPAPIARMLEAGIPVGLGTDSAINVGQLDLFAELRAARREAGLAAGEALALATTGAARALGLEREVGRLGRGWFGDVTAVGVLPERGEDPLEAILRAGPDDVMATVLGGRVVYRRDPAA
jgi:5-methylthioadenosine/S-adenosylhomocysteine deaminase